ncbi:DoxX family protein [Roseibium sp.]|uniref:DoxX family protein n=1 Tax=Roseibium sp. TaxID=1936156 RepID=UPI003A97BEF1
MNSTALKYGSIALRVVLAAVFLAAGFAKLGGVQMMVDSFAAIGIGQWFRYLTGFIEVGSAILLFAPGKQAYGAMLLVGTMIGAVLAHLFILGPSAVPAVVLGLLSAIVLFIYRGQLLLVGQSSQPLGETRA